MINFNQPPNSLDELIQFQSITSDDLKKTNPTSHAQVIFFLLKCIVILAIELSSLKWRPH